MSYTLWAWFNAMRVVGVLALVSLFANACAHALEPSHPLTWEQVELPWTYVCRPLDESYTRCCATNAGAGYQQCVTQRRSP